MLKHSTAKADVLLNRIESDRLISRYNDGVARLQLHILCGVLPFDDFLVVERQAGLCPIRILAQDVNRFLFRKIAEAPGESKCIQNGRRIGENVGSRPVHLADNVELLAIDLLDHGVAAYTRTARALPVVDRVGRAQAKDRFDSDLRLTRSSGLTPSCLPIPFSCGES